MAEVITFPKQLKAPLHLKACSKLKCKRCATHYVKLFDWDNPGSAPILKFFCEADAPKGALHI